jgi:hypothetical protein
LPWDAGSDCIIRPSSVASSGLWPRARSPPLTIVLVPAESPTITFEAKTWLVSLACRKAKDVGYPHELWATRLLASHAREYGPAEGHVCLANLAQGTVCKILAQEEVKPHKVRYYMERRDPDFADRMADVLSIYRRVKVLKKAAAAIKIDDLV